MSFSCGPWICQRDLIYAATLLRSGAPRVWYGVAAAGSPAFQSALSALAPAAALALPCLPLKGLCMAPPAALAARGVPLTRCVQVWWGPRRGAWGPCFGAGDKAQGRGCLGHGGERKPVRRGRCCGGMLLTARRCSIDRSVRRASGAGWFCCARKGQGTA